MDTALRKTTARGFRKLQTAESTPTVQPNQCSREAWRSLRELSTPPHRGGQGCRIMDLQRWLLNSFATGGHRKTSIRWGSTKTSLDDHWEPLGLRWLVLGAKSQQCVERLYHAAPSTRVKQWWNVATLRLVSHGSLYTLYSSRTNTKVPAWELSI